MSSCAIEGCEASAGKRGWCPFHYGRKYRAGEIQPLPAHRLSDIESTATREARGLCAICGPVELQVRRKGTRLEFACMNRVRESQERDRLRDRAKNYGITRGQLERMIADAAGLCAICDQPTGGAFHIDHCHTTGAVRGILCPSCNVGLGFFEDDPERMERARRYLVAHQRRISGQAG